MALQYLHEPEESLWMGGKIQRRGRVLMMCVLGGNLRLMSISVSVPATTEESALMNLPLK
jgi:hypothetical protein